MGQPFKLHSSRGPWTSTRTAATAALAPGPLLNTCRPASATVLCAHAGPQLLRGASGWASEVGRSHVHGQPWSQGPPTGWGDNFCKATESFPVSPRPVKQLTRTPPLYHGLPWALPLAWWPSIPVPAPAAALGGRPQQSDCNTFSLLI